MSADLETLKATWAAACETAGAAIAAERTAKYEYQAARSAAFRLQPGDIIRNELGVEAKVKHLEKFGKSVNVVVVLRIKDGTWGKKAVPAWQGSWNDAEMVHRPAPESAP